MHFENEMVSDILNVITGGKRVDGDEPKENTVQNVGTISGQLDIIAHLKRIRVSRGIECKEVLSGL